MGRHGMHIVTFGTFCLLLFLPVSIGVQSNNDDNSKPLPPSNDTHQLISTDTHKAIAKVTNLKVKVLLEKPYVMRSQTDPTSFEGMFIDLLDDITRRANLTYQILPVAEDAYGYEYSPGNWSGLIGSVVNKEAHLAVGPLTMRSKRQGVVDFTLPIMSAGLRILYKPADPWTDKESFTILLSPFTLGMWVLLLLMFVAVSVCLYLIGRFSPHEDHAFVGKAATYEGLTFFNSFLYVFTSMTFQGYTAAPRSLSGRVLVTFWWMFALLVVAAYTASLCAVFLSFKPSISRVPFASFDELSQQTDVAYGIRKNGMAYRYLSTSQRPLQRRLWGAMSANGDTVMVRSFSEGVDRVRQNPGRYAFIMEGPLAEYLSEQAPCDLMTLGEELNEHHWGFACQKDTNVCPLINAAILHMKEDDFILDLKKKWLHQGCNRDDPAEYVYRGLSYLDTFGTTPKYYADRTVTLRRFSIGFLCLMMGLCLSTCILFAEIFYAKRRGFAVPQRMTRDREDQERIDREYRDDDS